MCTRNELLLVRGKQTTTSGRRPITSMGYVMLSIAISSLLFMLNFLPAFADAKTTLTAATDLYTFEQKAILSGAIIKEQTQWDFGRQARISRDGKVAVISASGFYQNNGPGNGVFVYTQNGNGVWTAQQHLTNSASPPDRYLGIFSSVNHDGSVILFGDFNYPTSQAYFYTQSTISPPAWSLSQTVGVDSSFVGFKSYMSDSGDVALIEISSGTVDCVGTVLRKSGGSYVVEYLSVSDPSMQNVEIRLPSALSGDGQKVFVYVYGIVYAYQHGPSGWKNFTQFTVPRKFGQRGSVTTVYDGSKLVVVAAKFAYYSWNGVAYVQASIIPTPKGVTQSYGYTTRLFQQGTRLIISDHGYSNGIGAIYFFQLVGNKFVQYPGAYANPQPDPSAGGAFTSTNSAFGYGVDASEDGTFVVVGAYADRYASGAAFFLKQSPGPPPIVCNAQANMTKSECTTVIKACKLKGIKMKYAGLGCLGIGGGSANDGGCQCNNYCSYTCTTACKKDHQCTWSTTYNACVPKTTKVPTAAVSVCT